MARLTKRGIKGFKISALTIAILLAFFELLKESIPSEKFWLSAAFTLVIGLVYFVWLPNHITDYNEMAGAVPSDGRSNKRSPEIQISFAMKCFVLLAWIGAIVLIWEL